jgi:hypothetical protein
VTPKIFQGDKLVFNNFPLHKTGKKMSKFPKSNKKALKRSKIFENPGVYFNFIFESNLT